jgi:hypothetical protein
MIPRATCLAVALLVLGCGAHYWSKSGAGFDEFSQDNTACARENALYSSADRNYGVLRLETYRACLKARGWVRAQQVEPIPPGWFRGFEDDDPVRLDAPPRQPAAVQAAPAARAPASSRPEIARIVGTWSGTFTQQGGTAGFRHAATLRISDEGERVSWSMDVRGSDLDAAGLVIASPDEIKLSGTFTSRGFPVTYTVTVSGAALEAVGVGADNRVYQLTARKAR